MAYFANSINIKTDITITVLTFWGLCHWIGTMYVVSILDGMPGDEPAVCEAYFARCGEVYLTIDVVCVRRTYVLLVLLRERSAWRQG